MRALYIFGFIASVFVLKAEENTPIGRSQNNLGFIQNEGQIFDQNNKPNTSVKYLLPLANFNIQVKQNGFSYDLHKREVLKDAKSFQNIKVADNSSNQPVDSSKAEALPTQLRFYRIDVVFENSNPQAQIQGLEANTNYINVYNSVTPEKGANNIKHFNKILYKNLYEGVDLELLVLKDQTFKYNFYVQNEQALNKIKWRYHGAQAIEIDPAGNKLLIKTSLGDFDEDIPMSFFKSMTNGTQTKVDVLYKESQGAFQFQLKGSFPKESMLCIDPGGGSRFWGTYHSTSSESGIWGRSRIDLDGDGNLYLSTNMGDYNPTISKFNPSGVLQWQTPPIGFGSYNGTSITDLKFHSISNAIYIVGHTDDDWFIATSGAHDETYNFPGSNYLDAFVQKYDLSGNLIWGTYYGDDGTDLFSAVAIDGNSNIICGGATNSSSGISTAGSHQPAYGGGGTGASPGDAFIVKFDNNGVRLWATYYGGVEVEYCTESDICVDNSNNIYYIGSTESTSGIATAGSFQASNNGPFPPEYWIIGGDAFIVKFNSAGTRQWATYFGGTETEAFYASSIDCDAAGNVIFLTSTSSSGLHTAGAHQTTSSGTILAKFNSTGSRIWSTYYGNYSMESFMTDLMCDASNNIFFCGSSSSNVGLTTADAYQTIVAGGRDGYAAMFNSAGVRQWGTLYGGSLDDQLSGIHSYNASGDVYLSGLTFSNSSIATAGSHQESYQGDGDSYLVKLGPSCTTNPLGTITWTGLKDRNWNDCLNWDPMIIPTFQSNAVVPTTTNKPIIYTGTIASCNDITIDSDAGARVIIQGGAKLNTYYTDASVGSLNCASATFSPSTLTSGTSYSGTLTIPYTTGNGVVYDQGPDILSSGVAGINATLNSGTLASGAGNLTFSVTGTPTSGGTLSLPIIFGGKTCPVTKTVTGPIVTSLTSSGPTFNPSTMNRGVAYSGTMTLPYTGGNASPYQAGTAIPSIGIPGLTATLQSGTLASGSGNLSFSVIGTPSSAGTISFPIAFGTKTGTVSKTVGGAGCPGNIILEMTDANGDGWGGFTIQLKLSGTTLGNYTLNTGASQLLSIPISTAGTLQVIITALGDYPEEVSYSIRTISGNTWFSKSPSHSLGTANSANITCP